MEDRLELRVEATMRSGLSCTETILQVYNKDLELCLDDNALRMATGFAGGIGAKKGICGALTGAVMVIGALKGRVSPDEDRKDAMELSAEIYDKFQEEFGTVQCCDILAGFKLGSACCPGIVVPKCAGILTEAIKERFSY